MFNFMKNAIFCQRAPKGRCHGKVFASVPKLRGLCPSQTTITLKGDVKEIGMLTIN
jgi:hypothetical protein